MKLDLDPEKNRRQLASVRSFTVRYSVMFRKGFYQLIGCTFVLAGLVLFLDGTDTEELLGGNYKSEFLAPASVFLGIVVLLGTHFVSKWWAALEAHEPTNSSGDEWTQ